MTGKALILQNFWAEKSEKTRRGQVNLPRFQPFLAFFTDFEYDGAMTRPIYQSNQDAANADSAIRTFALATPWVVRRAKNLREFDYVLADQISGERKAIVEVKTRFNPRNQYSTYMISKFKVDTCVRVAKEYELPFLLVVNWMDDMGWVRIEQEGEYPHATGGRFDRRDSQDVEQVYHIPVKKFRTLADITPASLIWD
jgi:hypothetical protein